MGTEIMPGQVKGQIKTIYLPQFPSQQDKIPAGINIEPVSYTHLDVYKRQAIRSAWLTNGADSRRSVTNCWSLSALNGTCWIQTG